MRNSTLAVLGGLVALAAPLSAQTVYNPRVEAAMHVRGRFQMPLCPLKGSDFRTSSASLYLKSAVEGIQDDNKGGGRSEIDDKKYSDLVKKAVAAANEAIVANPQGAAGWYYLGRADLQLGDLQGSDSAFAKLATLSPECTEEVKGLRQHAWIALVTPSTDFMNKAQDTTLSATDRQAWTDSALAVLRAANLAGEYYPQGLYNLAATFVITKQYDSAIVYFKLARDKASADSQFAKMVGDATYDLARLYQQQHDTPDAIIELRKYVALDTTDMQSRRSLASMLRTSGDTAEASKLEGQLMSSGAMTPADLLDVGVRDFGEKDYAAAALAFQKVLTIEPNNHDALFDLASSYYWLEDGKNLIPAAQKLLDVDPLSMSAVKLLANGYRLDKQQDKQIDATTRLLAMTIDVKVEHFMGSPTNATLTGTATGNAAVNSSGKPIPPAPMTLVFEFTNNLGAVVATQDVAIPALQPNATQAISVAVTGPGIIAWRYHPKT